MTPRWYQSASVDAAWNHIRSKDNNPCVVLPTGAGKTHVIAQLCKDAVGWGGRVGVLAHVKELLEQNADKLRLAMPDVPIGIYSAGLGSRDAHLPVTVAGIQSVYRKAKDFDPFDVLIVDEAHLIPEDGDGMYRQFLSEAKEVSPHLRVIGLTATPYRLKSGMICEPQNILNEICYEVSVRELIAQGYLSPIKSWEGASRPDISGVAIRGGDYVQAELEQVTNENGLVRDACREIVAATEDRNSVLIFCCGVKHAHHVADEITKQARKPCEVITGETHSDERRAILEAFKRGDLKYLANVNVLTTGFDAPGVDCVVMLRPTQSPGLYYQMVGRGFRLAPGKDHCRVLDFGSNVIRHGPVDNIRLGEPNGMPEAKSCPECTAIVPTGVMVCPECGYNWPSREREARSDKHTRASVAGDLIDKGESHEHTVIDTQYFLHQKRDNPNAPPTMRVEYKVGNYQWVKEWVCIEHTGFARKKAEDWWAQRSNEPCPDTVDEAVSIGRDGGLTNPTTLLVERKPGEKYTSITRCVLGPRAPVAKDKSTGAWVQEWSADGSDYTADEVPF